MSNNCPGGGVSAPGPGGGVSAPGTVDRQILQESLVTMENYDGKPGVHVP